MEFTPFTRDNMNERNGEGDEYNQSRNIAFYLKNNNKNITFLNIGPIIYIVYK